ALGTRAVQAREAADGRALQAVAAQSQVEAAASRRAAANAGAVRQAEAAAAAETRDATQARTDGYLRSGLVLSAVLGAGVLQAVQLEKRMANVMTISKEINAGSVSGFTDQIVQMSTGLTQSSTQLAEGLYQIVSTGFDGADAMTILQVASKGASAGLTTTETSARALLGVLKAYGLTAGDASGVMDTMFQTVNKGVISFEELAQNLGDVVPMAAAAGVKFDDLSSAFAAITLSGVPAAESATALNQMMTRMMAPTTDLSNVMRKLGYESAASALQQDGLYVVVNKLTKATGGSSEAMTKLFVDVRATRAVLSLAANDGRNYADSYEGIANEVERAGATQKAFELQMNTTSGQWAMFSNRVQAVGVDLGRALLPALQSVGEALSVFAGAISDLPSPVRTLAGALLALMSATLLLRAGVGKVSVQFTAFRTAMAEARVGGAMLPAVLSGAGLAVSALAAVLTIGVLAYSAYSASKEKAKAATADLVDALRQEREAGDAGAGVRKLTEQLTNSDDMKKLEKLGISTTTAIDAITAGGTKLDELYAKIKTGRDASFFTTPNSPVVTYDTRWDDAKKILDKQHGIWSNAVKDEASLAAQMQIVNARLAASRVKVGDLFSLDQLLPVGTDGLPQYTDEMKAVAQALGDIVNPAKAWQDAQDKVAKSNKNAKASLKD
ncbi:phage tail tape measure protein, partial [Actinacidiphila soli]|uniref:phage tail tape measure protein n=1 Tax=Actinacidiphila soli TaxID=2487275 RepID=UPI000FCA95E5